ncbi:hypothetical protein VHEMI09889 [[Torrubiella] hemipterigena]|uniref:Uncharacterized protein n=1 Tax=[Torrubiella] hemipterigena TaxID=1531966 RepID=A0A0A1TBB9_9HYPO|nr:hypothetical protein VHEMI09889 [[Torrubiella] hemipterigena]
MSFVQLAKDFCEAMLPHVHAVEVAEAEEALRRRVALVDAIPKATDTELNDGLDLLAGYLSRYNVEDANRMANIAYIGSKLIDAGAEPRKLEILLEKLPQVLRAARRYADGLWSHMPAEFDEDETIVASMDGRRIPASVFYVHDEQDPAGRISLHLIYMWIIPTVVILTRDRELLQNALADDELQGSLRAVVQSDCQFLGMLLWGAFNEAWHIVLPTARRSFHIRVDGFVTNRAIFALISDVLIREAGIEGARNAPDVLSFLRGETEHCKTETAFCSFQFYTCKAGNHDWSTGSPPLAFIASSSGWPIDIPRFEGRKLLMLGPQPPKEPVDDSWPAGDTFINLYDPHRAIMGEPGYIPFTSPFQRLQRSVTLVHEVELEETNDVLAELAKCNGLN